MPPGRPQRRPKPLFSGGAGTARGMVHAETEVTGCGAAVPVPGPGLRGNMARVETETGPNHRQRRAPKGTALNGGVQRGALPHKPQRILDPPSPTARGGARGLGARHRSPVGGGGLHWHVFSGCLRTSHVEPGPRRVPPRCCVEPPVPITNVGRRAFNCEGGGGVNRAPQNGAGGGVIWQKGSIDRTIIQLL